MQHYYLQLIRCWLRYSRLQNMTTARPLTHCLILCRVQRTEVGQARQALCTGKTEQITKLQPHLMKQQIN